ncbi:MAG TPA: AAA family ATPase [Polyangiaceae bacterium]|nr:AAA family ATPase [Polyangiaceae bacterium]
MVGPPSNVASEFQGTERYKVRRRLGSGAFGVVYEAYDSAIGGAVALKVLHRPDGGALYRFKQEFRSLAHLKHPNLVALHDLASDSGRWFFTMELVDGVDVVRFVSGDRAPRERAPSFPESVDLALTRSEIEPLASISASAGAAKRPPQPVAEWPLAGEWFLDVPRLRSAFGQLARGVAALHAVGKVHRDIKPSNILVEASGRVVLLDFGLVTEPADPDATADLLVGTPTYMAPEQALGETVGPASDWYSVGCLLYLALTGRLPIVGAGTIDVLARKQFEVPAPPRLSRPDVPPDLDQLCMALLARRPCDRPCDADVLQRLPIEELSSGGVRGVETAAGQGFVGRSPELDTLARAYRSVRDGRTNVVSVRGRSGVGKTTLVRRFLEQASRADPRVVALTGRCYERESVPYKALDALIDSLRRYLRRLPKAELDAVLPRNLCALARLFPVFADVAGADERRIQEIRDPLELRRRGFAALRELLARLADRHELILFIDDFHWSDGDSIALLLEILAPPDPPSLLLLVCFRSEHAIAELEKLDSVATGPHVDRVDIELRGLADIDARTLVEHLLEHAPEGARGTQTQAILREAAGLPFMLVELASFQRARGNETLAKPSPCVAGSNAAGSSAAESSAAESLVDAFVRARTRLLEPDALRLLETICVAGQPLARSTASRAAGLEGERAIASLDALDVARLIRARSTPGATGVEAFHDRVREAVTAGMTPSVLQARHASVAEALEAEPQCDLERLSVHLCAAGQKDRARVHVERAADRATSTLAFERAVGLYRLALDLCGPRPAHALQTKLADALANAGYGGEAGHAYLAALPGATPEQAIDLRRRAAEQFLRSGHVAEALPTVEKIVSDVGLRMPATPALSLASLLFQRAMLRVRGLGFTERHDVPVHELRKIDVCWALGNGIGGIDLVRGADFQARHLLLALRAGEPYRIARALAWEGVLSAIEGGAAGHSRAAAISAEAMVVATRNGNPHGVAWATAAEAICRFCSGKWKAARIVSEQSIALFREHCADVGWEVGSMEMWWWLPAMRWLGEYAPIVGRAAPCAKEAAERGDLYTVTGVRTHVLPHVHLMADRADDARQEGREAILKWSQQDRWLTHHWCNAVTQAHACLYAMRLGEALDGVERDARRIEGSLQSRMQTMRVQFTDVRARVMVAAAREDTRRRKSLLSAVDRSAGLLAREDLDWAGALGAVVQGAAACVRGDLDGARESYRRAARAFTELDMTIHALAAQARMASIEGGDSGRSTRSECLARIGERGVKRPDRFAEMLVP